MTIKRYKWISYKQIKISNQRNNSFTVAVSHNDSLAQNIFHRQPQNQISGRTNRIPILLK